MNEVHIFRGQHSRIRAWMDLFRANRADCVVPLDCDLFDYTPLFNRVFNTLYRYAPGSLGSVLEVE